VLWRAALAGAILDHAGTLRRSRAGFQRGLSLCCGYRRAVAQNLVDNARASTPARRMDRTRGLLYSAGHE
ncbi:unnamed protein product, partial [Acidocella sp. C78]